ncbi:MAG: hypothetical protein PHO67_08070 [Candidatus Omnitrophica bacterium]|nr:hypothetical protein [Candidatus Omnitrophota bacterium]
MDKDNKKATVSDVIPFRPVGGDSSDQPALKKKVTADDILASLNEQLEIAKIGKIGQAMGAFDSPYSNRVASSVGENNLEQLAKVGNMLGIDFTKISEIRQRETEALRSELDQERRANLEMRLGTIDSVVARMYETMQAFVKSQNEARNNSGASGLFGLADQVTGNALTTAAVNKLLNLDQAATKPKDPVDEILDRLSLGDRLKRALGVEEPQRTALDPSSIASIGRLEVARLLLDDDRERERMRQTQDLQKMKMEKLGSFFEMVQSYMPDILAAVSPKRGGEKDEGEETSTDVTAPRPAPRPQPKRSSVKHQEPPSEPDRAQAVVATKNTPLPEQFIIEEVACPHPGCGKPLKFPVNIPAGYGVVCPHCNRDVVKGPDAEAPVDDSAPDQADESKEKDRKG